MKTHKHTLRNKKKQNDGWNDILFSALEDSSTEPAIKRVEKVLGLLVAAESHRHEHNNFNSRALKGRGVPEFLALSQRIKDTESAYLRTLEALNIALRRYRWGARVKGDFDGFRSELVPLATKEKSWEYWEPFVVAELLKCANTPGEISRFRRCPECQNWFHAIRGHQQFCNASCRRHHAAQDPEFKAKRRTYMREQYRPLQRELQERSVRRAQGSHQTKGRG